VTRLRVVLVATVVALAAAATPAGARHEVVEDPRDTPGRLDVQMVRLRHDEGPPQWRIVTFARWTIPQIWDLGYLVVELDTRADDAIDFRVVVRSDGRRLEATLYRVRRDGATKATGTVPAGKAGGRASAVRVPLRKLEVGSNRLVYRWSVATLFTGSTCPKSCLDRVPDVGLAEQPVPGVTPSPTPSPSPTP
jgi:hypothetical protein